MSDEPLSQSEIILYQTEDGRTRIQCRFENETVWLSQALIAELFQKDLRTINEHIQNVFEEGELSPESVIRKFRITAADAELEKITTTYHHWRGDPHPTSGHPLPVGEGRGEGNPGYADVAGFCKSATTAEIAAHGHILTPGRYVGAEEIADDGDPFEEKMPRLVAELHAQFAESAKLEAAIRKNLKGLSYAL